MNLRIDKPILNRPNSEENIVIINKWISDTADKMNLFIEKMNREERGRDAKDKSN